MANEAQVSRTGRPAYNNLPAQMVADGLITSNAYSLWLDDRDASTGSILFGGVDTEQYTGNMSTLPIQAENGQYTNPLITLTALTLNNTILASDLAQAILLDSGSSLTYLPDTLASAIYQSLSARYDPSLGAAYVPCSLASNSTTNTSLTFTFSVPTIAIPLSELIIPILNAQGHEPTFPDGVPACLFGIAPAGDDTPVLGDTFLRSAYVVYDLANNAISIAQTKFNTTESNILEIGGVENGTDSGVPGAIPVRNPVSATALLGMSMSAASATVSAVAPTATGAAMKNTKGPGEVGLVMGAAGLVFAALQ